MSVNGKGKKQQWTTLFRMVFLMNYYYALHKTVFFMVFCMRILFHKLSKKYIIWLCSSALQIKQMKKNTKENKQTASILWLLLIIPLKMNSSVSETPVVIMINLYQKTFIHNGDWFVSSLLPIFQHTHSFYPATHSLITRIVMCVFHRMTINFVSI